MTQKILKIVLPHLVAAVTIGSTAGASGKYGILGRKAPELDLDTWIDGQGNRISPIYLRDFRGKVIYLY